MGTGLHLYREWRERGEREWHGTGEAEEYGGRDLLLCGLLGHPRWLRGLLVQGGPSRAARLQCLPIHRGAPPDLAVETLGEWLHGPTDPFVPAEANPDWHSGSWATREEFAGVLGQHRAWFAQAVEEERARHEEMLGHLRYAPRWSPETQAGLLALFDRWQPPPWPSELDAILARLDADRQRGRQVRAIWWFDN